MIVFVVNNLFKNYYIWES